MDPIEIHYTLTEREFMRACRAHWQAHRQSDAMNIIAGVAGIGIGLYVHRFAETWGLIFMILSSLLLVLTFLRAQLCRRGYRQAAKYTQSVHVIFREDGIHVDSADGVSDLKWTYYSRYHVSPEAVILYMTSRAFSVIPKKDFANEEELERFLDLVATKLKPVRRSQKR